MNEHLDSSSQPPTDSEIFARLDNLWKPQADSPALNMMITQIGPNGRHQIIREVGRGGFGVVYQAYDTELQRFVAIKLPRPEVILNADKLRRFEQEATMSASFDHPGVVPIYEANLSHSPPYIASAFCQGPDLADWLDGRSCAVPPRQAVEFIILVCDAVHYIHLQGVLHRDLKPANIMLQIQASEKENLQGDSEKGTSLTDYFPRLTDFGLSKIIEESIQQTRASLMIGTPTYMAPEQLESRNIAPTREADIYAIGVLLFEILSLQTPYEGRSYLQIVDQVRSHRPLSLSELNSDISADLVTICKKAMAKVPEDRYQTAKSLKEDLERFLNGQAIQAKPVSRATVLRRWCQRPERITQAGIMAIVTHSLIIMWLLSVAVALSNISSFGFINKQNAYSEMTFVILLFHTPLTLLGWFTIQKKRWAFWPLTIGSALVDSVMVYSILFSPLVFEFDYNTPLTKISIYVGLLIICSIQTGLLFLAIPAWMQTRPANVSKIDTLG